jgi:hypothetical protein
LICFSAREVKACPISEGPLYPSDGDIGLNTLLMDAERIKDNSWLGDKVPGCAPLPGLELWDITIGQIKAKGLRMPPLVSRLAIRRE